MRWTKGKPAKEAPWGIPVLCLREARGGDYPVKKLMFVATRKTSTDRLGNPCSRWVGMGYCGEVEMPDPDRYWNLP